MAIVNQRFFQSDASGSYAEWIINDVLLTCAAVNVHVPSTALSSLNVYGTLLTVSFLQTFAPGTDTSMAMASTVAVTGVAGIRLLAGISTYGCGHVS